MQLLTQLEPICLVYLDESVFSRFYGKICIMVRQNVKFWLHYPSKRRDSFSRLLLDRHDTSGKTCCSKAFQTIQSVLNQNALKSRAAFLKLGGANVNHNHLKILV